MTMTAAPITSFDESLHESLCQVEDDLIDAALGGYSSMADFVDRLSSITQLATHGIANRLLSSRTLTLVRRVSSNMSSVARNFRQLEPRTAEIEKRRQDDMAELFARFSLNEPLKRRECSSSSSSPKTPSPELKSKSLFVSQVESENGLKHRVSRIHKSKETSGALPPHIPHAYNWLTSNLHNPYPSFPVRKRISLDSGVSLKTVSDWFMNVRRRIGWTAISKQHFCGDRSSMIDAAYRVFADDSLRSTISPQLLKNFLAVERTLTQLYDGKIEASEYARNLPILPTDQSNIKISRRRIVQPNIAAVQRTDDFEASYGRKRKASSEEEVSDCESSSRNNGLKRLRASSSSSFLDSSLSSNSVSTPSTTRPHTPNPSFQTYDQPIDSWLSSIVNEGTLAYDPSLEDLAFHFPTLEQQTLPNPRKRRLSSSSTDPSPTSKHHRGAPVALDAQSSNLETQSYDALLASLDFSMPSSDELRQQLPADGLQVDLFDWTSWNASLANVPPVTNADDCLASLGLLPPAENVSSNPPAVDQYPPLPITESSIAGLDESLFLLLENGSVPQNGSVEIFDFTILNELATSGQFTLPTGPVVPPQDDISFAPLPSLLPCSNDSILAGDLSEIPLVEAFSLEQASKRERLRQLREETRKLEQDLILTI